MKSKKQTEQGKLSLKEVKDIKIIPSKVDPKQTIKKYNYGSFISKFSIQHWKEKYKQVFKKRDIFLVIMQLRNGKYDMFTIATTHNYFSYKRGMYYVDPDMVREDSHTGLNSLYYHQDCSVPFKLTFDLDKLRETVRNEDTSVEKALNPNNLKGFINSQVIEKVLKGQELTDDMRFIKMMIVIVLLGIALIGFMIARSMGWL